MGVPEVPASLRSWMSAVSEIVRSVNDAEPLARVLTRVAGQACELIGFEFCAVMLADERREYLQVAGCRGLTPDYLAQVSDGQGLRIRPPGPDLDTPAARAFREERTIVVPDVGQARSYGRLGHLAPTQGYRALLVSPLRGPGELAGVIVGYSVTARQFSPPELELIDLLGGQAALALETARLRADQQEVIRKLSVANEEMRRGRAVLEWAEQQHRQLMQLVLDEVELPELVGAPASALRASVTVEDTEGRVLARAPAEGYGPPPALRPGGRARPGPHSWPRRNPAGATRWPGSRSRDRTDLVHAAVPPGPPRSWSAASWPGACGSPIRPPNPSRSSSGSSSGSPSSSRCCCSSSGTCTTCRAGSPAICSATCSGTAGRSARRPSWTGPRPSGTTCPGRTCSRC
jgi:GAF domain-containing protein